jgi:DNA polymerase V
MSNLFALIDCDNFFVSCERLFRPDLNCRGIVVLSSNDGCVVSRSQEAKALGIPMGAPAFLYRHFFRDHDIVVFSANFELYGDISRRLLSYLTSLTPSVEAYSVDEAFVGLAGITAHNWQKWGQSVRTEINREIGIPVSIGIANTKTLAKLAAWHAKRTPDLGGVLQLDPTGIMHYLAETPLEEIWGVGRRLAPRLKAAGVHTALDVQRLRPRFAEQLMGLHGRQLVSELSGQSSHPIADNNQPRKSIMHGRMFGEDTTDWTVIEAAAVTLTAKATLRLRREGLLAKRAGIFISTNRHKPGYRRWFEQIRLEPPTADGGSIAEQLLLALRKEIHATIAFHRLSILLDELTSDKWLQTSLLKSQSPQLIALSGRRLQAVDSLNNRYGPRMVRYAAEDLSASWQPKRALRSPRYTTEWSELPII